MKNNTKIVTGINIWGFFGIGIPELYGESKTESLGIPVTTGVQNHGDLPPGHHLVRPLPQ